MNRITLLFLAASALMLSSCGQKSVEFKTYDLDAVSAKRDLKMSELADNLRLVQLESGKGFLVSAESDSWVNDKYIIIFGKNAIEQFSAVDGKHIRTLAIKGGGPNEYNYVVNPRVDDARQILYFNKVQSESIKCIDLNTGVFLPDIEAGKKNVNLAGITDDGKLIISSKATLFDYLDPQTGVRDGFYPADTTETASSDSEGVVRVIGIGSGMNFFVNREEVLLLNDTLYSVEGKQLVKRNYFTFKDDVGKGEWGREGTSLRFIYADNKSMIFSVEETRMKVERSGDEITSISISVDDKMNILIDRKSADIARIDKFIIDPSFEFEGDVTSRHRFFRGSSIVAYSIEAFELAECIEKALDSDDLSSSVKTQLSSLSATLTEDSNPIVVIGTKK